LHRQRVSAVFKICRGDLPAGFLQRFEHGQIAVETYQPMMAEIINTIRFARVSQIFFAGAEMQIDIL